MKHTPGPWTVDETKAMGAYGVWTDTDPMIPVCYFHHNRDRVPRDEQDANAKLIAAAPDLLRCLSNLINDLDNRALRRYLNMNVVKEAKAVLQHLKEQN